MKLNRFVKALVLCASIALGSSVLAGCTGIPATALSPSGATVLDAATPAQAATATQPAGETRAPAAPTFTDPFAYCGAVGNIDRPDARYNGPRMPEDVARGLKKASGASADAPLDVFVANSFWRCMDGKVVACFVGANLPCEAKANTDKTPTPAETEYCAANPGAENIPAFVTGHDTVYEWGCKDGKPEVTQQVLQMDARGFIANFWYAIARP